VTINLNTINNTTTPGNVASRPTLNNATSMPIQQEPAVNLYDYYYERRQSEYWHKKAERYQLDCQSLKQERNLAWKE